MSATRGGVVEHRPPCGLSRARSAAAADRGTRAAADRGTECCAVIRLRLPWPLRPHPTRAAASVARRVERGALEASLRRLFPMGRAGVVAPAVATTQARRKRVIDGGGTDVGTSTSHEGNHHA
jgi:hypothetical protein